MFFSKPGELFFYFCFWQKYNIDFVWDSRSCTSNVFLIELIFDWPIMIQFGFSSRKLHKIWVALLLLLLLQISLSSIWDEAIKFSGRFLSIFSSLWLKELLSELTDLTLLWYPNFTYNFLILALLFSATLPLSCRKWWSPLLPRCQLTISLFLTMPVVSSSKRLPNYH